VFDIPTKRSANAGPAPVVTAPPRDHERSVIWAAVEFTRNPSERPPSLETGNPAREYNSRLAFARTPILVPLAALDHVTDLELIRVAVAQGFTRDDYAWIWVT